MLRRALLLCSRHAKRVNHHQAAARVVPGRSLDHHGGPDNFSDPQWVSLTRQVAAQLHRTRTHDDLHTNPASGGQRSYRVQEDLIRRVVAELSKHPPLIRDTSTPHVTSLILDARRLVAYTATFHLSGVLGIDPQNTERHLVAIGNTMFDVVRVLGAWRGGALDASVCSELVGLLLVAATYFCRGVREWELLIHDEPFGSGADAAMMAWEHLSTCGGSVFYHQHPVALLFGHPLGAQRRWLIAMPLALVAVCTEVDGLGVDWSHRVALVALANILSLGLDLRLLHDADWDKLVSGITTVLRLFPSAPDVSQGLACRRGTLLPRWAMGMLGPLLPARVLATVWWPAHTIALDTPPQPSTLSPVVGNEGLRLAWVIPSLKVVHVPPALSVLPLKRCVYASVVSLDNTRVEWASLTHDLLRAIPKSSLPECRVALRELHDRSSRPVVGAVTKRLLETTLRVLVCRCTVLLAKALSRHSVHHRRSDDNRNEHRAALDAFRGVYQDTSDVLFRWNLADDELPEAYWRAVACHLD